MKGASVEEEIDTSTHSTPMFAKLHQPQKYHFPPPQSQPTTLLHHHPLNPPRECQASEEVDSHQNPTTTATKTQTSRLQTPPSGNDGATIEVVRRPRGRPPGSKNKPKPPVIITRDAEPSMSPYVLEIPGGADILETITTFCSKRNTGLCILNGTGTVSNVTLRQPSTTPPASVTFHGRFDILSLSATILPSNPHHHPSNLAALITNGVAKGFTISIAGPQGQVVGGAVAGPLLTAGTVYIIAASFNSPSFHRLPLEDHDERNSGSAAGGGSEGPSPPTVSGGGSGGGGEQQAAAGGGVPLYSPHLSSDVIWRQPAHPPPY